MRCTYTYAFYMRRRCLAMSVQSSDMKAWRHPTTTIIFVQYQQRSNKETEREREREAENTVQQTR